MADECGAEVWIEARSSIEQHDLVQVRMLGGSDRTVLFDGEARGENTSIGRKCTAVNYAAPAWLKRPGSSEPPGSGVNKQHLTSDSSGRQCRSIRRKRKACSRRRRQWDGSSKRSAG